MQQLFAYILQLLARFVIQILQRCLWHPLRAVPGPWANSVSELPAALALVTGNQHLYYKSLHDKYGPVVRVSPNELSFVRPEAREEIYGLRVSPLSHLRLSDPSSSCLQKGGLNMEKSPIFLGAVGGVDGQTGVSLALNADHARQRRALGYLFTNSALLKFENLLKIQVERFIAVLGQKADDKEPADLSSWCKPRYQSGLICDLQC